MRPFKFRIGLRVQLLLSASLLLAIPYLGYRSVWELETYLRIGQEQTMVGTARAVATALHERPQLFDNQSAFLNQVEEKKDLYAHKISAPIRLDGRLTDWQDLSGLMHVYGRENLLFSTTDYSEEDISFKHVVGQFGEYLYAMFEVVDDQLVYRDRNSLSVDQSDFLQIGLSMPEQGFKRFIVAPFDSEWVNAYLLDENNKAVALERKIQGQWQQTDQGYNVELRLPLDYLNGQIAFALSDVDDVEKRVITTSIGTANPNVESDLGTVLVPSPQIEQIIKGLEYSNSRVWVVDTHKRVLARSGDIQKVGGFEQLNQAPTGNADVSVESLWSWFEHKVLLPIYYQVLTKPPSQFVDELKDAFALKGRDIDAALSGEPSTLWRLSADNKAVILSASHPIFIEGKVMGAVVVEQTTNGIRTLRNKALEELFHLLLLIVLVSSVSLLLISTRLSNRIRRLNSETESAIDAHGKIKAKLKPSDSQDEIGELSRTFVNVIDRLAQYNNYLENMASRLSHELRTPVAIVNSSLDLLALDPDAKEAEVYTQRAREGIKRLSAILTKMSEATRLEQTIQHNETELFDLSSLLKGCAQGYQLAHPERSFKLSGIDQPFKLLGSPDLFAQMLDKVVSNAIEFGEEGSEIFMNLVTDANSGVLYVSNKGPLLPENMGNELFDSMVSVREDEQSVDGQKVHLGLGLYLAKIIAEFHGAKLRIQNQNDLSGVVVSIQMPSE